MKPCNFSMFLICYLCTISIFGNGLGHSTLNDPPPRGALRGHDYARDIPPVDRSAPNDGQLHYPAGNRGSTAGSGLASQEREGRNIWTLFDPLRPGFRWRSGVCGDLKGRNEAHRRGGEFYHGGMITRTYRVGSVVDFKASIVGHHNGFYVFHICDVSRCGGEISESCFRNGACRLLTRADNLGCAHSDSCGPIDRAYPGRWYIPCPNRANNGGIDHYGRNGNMRYRLPSGFSCEHCVLHWSYTTGNRCNAPGAVDYFEGPNRPRAWGNCRGQSAAVGGFSRDLQTCGGRQFAEDYFNCADVRIIWPSAPRRNPIKEMFIGEIRGSEFVKIRRVEQDTVIAAGRTGSLTVEAYMHWAVEKVEFFIVDNGSRRLLKTMNSAPYYVGGSDELGVPRSWNPIRGRRFRVIVRAGGFELSGSLLLA